MLGFGNVNASLQVYIANRPPMEEFDGLNGVLPIQQATIDRINTYCGNHWRKIFNVLAKLMFARSSGGFDRWQAYRDHKLLTESDDLCLLFNWPQPHKSSELPLTSMPLRIIAGKSYAQSCVSELHWQWIDERFAIIPEHRIIVSPYPDYRQLSDRRLETLLQLIDQFNDN